MVSWKSLLYRYRTISLFGLGAVVCASALIISRPAYATDFGGDQTGSMLTVVDGLFRFLSDITGTFTVQVVDGDTLDFSALPNAVEIQLSQGSESVGQTVSPGLVITFQGFNGGGTHTLILTNFDDQIVGSGDRDIINAGDGNDTINGYWGDDVIDGGTGNDNINGGAGYDIIHAGAGDDTLQGAHASGSPDLIGNALYGDEGNDTLFGSDGYNILEGGSGDDVIFGRRSADAIAGGEGNDTIYGSFGNDTIDAGAGDDFVNGGMDNDTITGGEGDDRLDGESGNDTVIGGTGDDVLIGNYGDDTLDGESGDDSLDGGQGDDTLIGGEGADGFYGGEGTDTRGDTVKDDCTGDVLVSVEKDHCATADQTPDPTPVATVSPGASVPLPSDLCVTRATRVALVDDVLVIYSDFTNTPNGMIITQIPLRSLRAITDDEKLAGAPVWLGYQDSEYASGWGTAVYWQNSHYGFVIYKDQTRTIYDDTGAICGWF